MRADLSKASKPSYWKGEGKGNTWREGGQGGELLAVKEPNPHLPVRSHLTVID